MANGMAEAAVKRVKNLLNRHTVLMRNWHQSLSLLQFALNSVVHTSTGVSPYFALFGRDPVSMAEMEFPELEFTETTGESFVADRVHTMKTIWEMVREASDDIKQKRAMQQNARSRVTAEPLASLVAGDHVWLKYGDDRHVQRLRHAGQPWKRRYKVVDINRDKGYVEIDPGNTTVNRYQSLRRVVKAAAAFNYNDVDDVPGRGDGPTQVELETSALAGDVS